ncbi:uncharacterized protein LOC101525866 isoform X1 [Ochotona princeps]|uniref:uncharacterized protein LOC101525866 isoform X1 n=1 Tax=Ochotona princeps TaxID=9978 RepID=UPI00271457EB|nr:uncharacterized protein LOC101525866 isoform X1 [Ochotona princeps]
MELGASVLMAASRKVLWRFVSGTLGIICLLLMTTLGIVMKNVFSKPSNQSTFSPEVTIELQEEVYELKSRLLLDWTLLSGRIQFQMFQSLTPKDCVVYAPSKVVLNENCEKSYPYICKKRLI